RPTPRALGVAVPDAVELVFQRALAVDPRERYARAGEFWSALDAATQEAGLAASTTQRVGSLDATKLASLSGTRPEPSTVRARPAPARFGRRSPPRRKRQGSRPPRRNEWARSMPRGARPFLERAPSPRPWARSCRVSEGRASAISGARSRVAPRPGGRRRSRRVSPPVAPAPGSRLPALAWSQPRSEASSSSFEGKGLGESRRPSRSRRVPSPWRALPWRAPHRRRRKSPSAP